MLNSNALFMLVISRMFGRRVVLKLHYLQYQTVHWQYSRMRFWRRIGTEIVFLLRKPSSLTYKLQCLGRLFFRTVSALLASTVCACSAFCAEQASLPRRVRILRNPIRLTPGLRAREVAALERPFRFVFIGRLTKDKGWESLVSAAHGIAQTGRDFRFDIIGAGEDYDAMKERIDYFGLATHFVLHGKLGADAILEILQCALAAIVPSRYNEPAGYVPLEAASRCVVSIVANVGGLAEVGGPDCPSFATDCPKQLEKLAIHYLDYPQDALAAGYAAYIRAGRLFSPRDVAGKLMRMLGER
jgi:glycosyltransferase involved in cell wall biosynthesis